MICILSIYPDRPEIHVKDEANEKGHSAFTLRPIVFNTIKCSRT